MSKAIGRIYGVGSRSPYGYETDYMKYLQGYNPYDYEQTLRNMSQSYADVRAKPEYNLNTAMQGNDYSLKLPEFVGSENYIAENKNMARDVIIDSYNNSKSTKITTYAARCIENEILMFFRSNKKNLNNVSLNDSIGYDKDGNEINLIDVLKDNSPDMNDIIHTKDNISLLNKYLNLLNEREKEIIIKRYGLCGSNEYTQKEIAKQLKISRSYVSRIEKRALTKILKEFIKTKNEI